MTMFFNTKVLIFFFVKSPFFLFDFDLFIQFSMDAISVGSVSMDSVSMDSVSVDLVYQYFSLKIPIKLFDLLFLVIIYGDLNEFDDIFSVSN